MLPRLLSQFLSLLGVFRTGGPLYVAVRAGHPPGADDFPVKIYLVETHTLLVQGVFK